MSILLVRFVVLIVCNVLQPFIKSHCMSHLLMVYANYSVLLTVK